MARAWCGSKRSTRTVTARSIDGGPYKQAPPGQASQGGRGAQNSPDKTIERIERATRHDGIVSRWEYFENGSLARVEEDTDGDGKIDKWETYAGGTLSIMALDTLHRGAPTRRLIYRPDGTLDRIEEDLTAPAPSTRSRQPPSQ